MQYFLFKYYIFFFILYSVVVHSEKAHPRMFSKLLLNIICGIFLLVLTGITFAQRRIGRSCLEQEIKIETGEQLGLKYRLIFQKVRTRLIFEMLTHLIFSIQKEALLHSQHCSFEGNFFLR